jgi:hypothetical protein
MRKAQGVIDPDTNEPIDVGYEVSLFKNYIDAQKKKKKREQDEITEMKRYAP